MSEASIIQQLTLNQATTFTTTTSVNRVKIHNDSSYYLRVYFGQGAPSRPDQGGWHDTISPSASPVVAVVGAARAVTGLDFTNNQSTGTYQGQIVIFPFMPIGAPIPGGGVVSGASLCYLTGYYPEEYAETAGQVEAFVQSAKQGRYQSVLGAAPEAFTSAFTDQTTVFNTDICLLDNISSTTAPNLFTANAAGTSFVNYYIYYLALKLRTRGPATAGVDLNPVLALMNSADSVTRNTQTLPFRILLQATNFGTDQFVFSSSTPLSIQFVVAQNTLVSGDRIYLRYSAGSGAPIASYGLFEIGWSAMGIVDAVNQNVDYAMPGHRLVSEPAWSAYNPQTY